MHGQPLFTIARVKSPPEVHPLGPDAARVARCTVHVARCGKAHDVKRQLACHQPADVHVPLPLAAGESAHGHKQSAAAAKEEARKQVSALVVYRHASDPYIARLAIYYPALPCEEG